MLMGLKMFFIVDDAIFTILSSDSGVAIKIVHISSIGVRFQFLEETISLHYLY